MITLKAYIYRVVMSLSRTQTNYCIMFIPFISIYHRLYLLISSNCLGKVVRDLIQLRDII